MDLKKEKGMKLTLKYNQIGKPAGNERRSAYCRRSRERMEEGEEIRE